VLRELLDGIAAVQQYARVAINVGDLAVGRRRHPEAGIVGKDTQIFVDR